MPPLPRPRLVLPRYTPQEIFKVFSAFLAKHEFTHTSSVLAKELLARGFADEGDLSSDAADARSGARESIITDAMLQEHIAFCVAQLQSVGGDDAAGGEDRGEAGIETGIDAGAVQTEYDGGDRGDGDGDEKDEKEEEEEDDDDDHLIQDIIESDEEDPFADDDAATLDGEPEDRNDADAVATTTTMTTTTTTTTGPPTSTTPPRRARRGRPAAPRR